MADGGLACAPAKDPWAALGQSRLRLAPGVEFTEQVHRGQAWVVVHDRVHNQYFKTTRAVRQLLLALDGSASLDDTLRQPALTAFERNPDHFMLLAQLLEAGVLIGDFSSGQDAIEKHRQRQQSSRRLRWLRPWMLKVPLANPDPWLTRLHPRLSFLWSQPMLTLWLGLMAAALLLLSDHLSALIAYGQARFLDPVNLLLVALIYPVLKLLHELAHGLTTKKWGGEVVEMGVILLVFVPVPYVDASASTRFAAKSHRILVAASGVMVELTLAALALLVWLNTDSILLKDICFNVMVIGGVSTVFFNGNPLLRFDGYYVLSDALEIPNLASKSQQYLAWQFQARVLGLPVPPPALTEGEAKWLAGYGVLAGVYRVLVSFAVAVFIAGQYFFLGVALALWALLVQLAHPSYRALKALVNAARREEGALARLALIASAFVVLTALALFAVPFNQTTSAEGVLVVRGEQEIKTRTEGFLVQALVPSGATVEAGQALLRFENPTLVQELARVRARMDEVEVLVNQHATTDPAQAALNRDELATLGQQARELANSLTHLVMKSPASGRLEIPQLDNQLGRYFNKGHTLGVVQTGAPPRALVVMRESSAGDLARALERVHARLHAHPLERFAVRHWQEVPMAGTHLPNRFLGSLYGGKIPVDTSDAAGVSALEPVIQFEMEIDLPPTLTAPGARLSVEFVHASEPIGYRLLRRLRGFFLEHYRL